MRWTILVAAVATLGVAPPAVADQWPPQYSGTITKVYLDAEPTDNLGVIGAEWPTSAEQGLEVGIYVTRGTGSARIVWGIDSAAPSGTTGTCRPQFLSAGVPLYAGPPLQGTVGAFKAGNLVPGLYLPTGGTLLEGPEFAGVTRTVGRTQLDVSLDCGALGSAAFTVPLVVVPNAPLDRDEGVSINDGADFTNTPSVRLYLGWDGLVDKIKASNDGGFAPSKSKEIRLDSEAPPSWRLVDLGNERLPKTVYVKLHHPVYGWSESFTDDIVLDTVKPQVVSVSISGSGAASLSAGSRTVRVKARDNKSGLASIQISAGKPKKTAKVLQFRKSVSAPKSGRVFVRVRDGAGN
jgi:hypothetical protein